MQTDIKHLELCPDCRRQMTILGKINESKERNIDILNTCFICENKKCILLINVEDIKTWRKI